MPTDVYTLYVVASGSPQGLCRNCAKREEECCIQDIHRHLLQEA